MRLPHACHASSRLHSAIRLLAVALLAAAALRGAEPTRKTLDLPADAADRTLRKFTEQAGVEVVFATGLAAGVRTNAVKGNYPPLEAMTLLLEGTGLAATQDKTTGAFLVVRRENPVEPKKDAARAETASVARSASVPDAIVELNPFVISVNPDEGYAPTETLAGTRLKALTKDVPSALSIISTDMLADLGASNFNDVLDYLPSTSQFQSGEADPGASAARNGNPFTVRGFTSNSLTANFFSSLVPIDAYNTSRLTFTRGPNSILFGVGNPGGGLDTTTNVPSLEKNSHSLSLRVDSFDSYRATINSSMVLLPGRLGLRVDLLQEDRQRYVKPAENERSSFYSAVTYRPFPQTSITVNGELTRIRQHVPRGVVAYDRVSPWRDAGSPVKPVFGNITATNGLEFTNSNGWIVVVEGQPGIAPMDWARAALGGRYSIDGVPNNRSSFSRPEIVPLNTYIAGESSPVKRDASSAQIFLQQSIGPKLFIELAASYQHLFLRNFDAFTLNDTAIRVDANQQLPTGAPNPNVGVPYIETSAAFALESPYDSGGARATVSYEVDLNRVTFFGRKLGVLRLAGLLSHDRLHQLLDSPQETNLTPLRTNGTFGRLDNAVNQIRRRYYLRPGSNPYFTSDFAPINSGGIRSGFARVRNAPRDQITATNASVVTMQADLLENRIVATVGARRDRIRLDNALYARDSRGVFPAIEDSSGTESRTDFGNTHSAGVVVNVTRQLGLFANQSTNFIPPSATVINPDGSTGAPVEGVGYDLGLKLQLLGGRLHGSILRFSSEQQNVRDPTLVGQKRNAIAAIWNSIDLNRAPPANWEGFKDTETEGYEIQLVGNPTPQLRLMVNGSKNVTKVSDRGGAIFAYVDRNLAEWQSQSALPVVSNLGSTVGDLVRLVRNEVANDKATIGLRQTRTSEWQISTVARYRFSDRSRLKGAAVGAAGTWRNAPIIGFANVPGTELFDISRPFYGAEYFNLDVWAEYSRPILQRRVRWETQLRIENLTDPRTAAPWTAIDDGTGRRWVEERLLPRGLGVVLSSKFSF